MSFSNEEPLLDQQKIWAAVSLKQVVEEALLDKKFIGMSRYIHNIEIFWSRTIKTACAGHGFIFFNPDFFDTLNEETRKTVIAHEVWHLILRHLERGKNCDPYQYNMAADHVINNALEIDGFDFKGIDCLKDPIYRDMSTEQVYNVIYEKTPKDKPPTIPDDYVSSEQIKDMIEEVLEQKGEGTTIEEQENKNEKNIKVGVNPGNKSSSLGRILEISKKTKTTIIGATYQDIFKKYLTDPLSGGKRTFMRPNRKQHGMGKSSLKLPGRFPKRGHINRLTHLTYALDVSGSITDKQANQFHQSVYTIKKLLNPSKLTILFFDTKIVLEKTFTDRQEYTQIKVNAGGGTNLKDVYRRTEELKSEALVIFTDLCVDIPPKPDWDTIWLVPENIEYLGNTIDNKEIYGDVYLIPEDKV